VDRLWPRGVRKDAAALTVLLKEIAPSAELRTWFGHDPSRWQEFSRRYRSELRTNKSVEELRSLLAQGTVTLLYGAHDETHNQAVVLADYIRGHAKPAG
jgi:uncharacterized protein YeaO (DUF488 family)